ncbi:GntR family transcriptional regulator [Sphingomonas sp. ERG5]|uniref:GntR family transcriptional regulator n=1 Tax=Sphingomonas sp. ERG5 TaxID=1381597 RepID=UPI0013648D89|nr:GntR family transcriptional regulator [Sphingomonas sp. ERG5]
MTAERVYDALKSRLLSGALLPGERLEPARFAEELASSVTPVRDALHRLTGERLVEARASDGFHLPLVTEAHLRDLYAWNTALLHLAVQSWRQTPSTVRADTLAADAGRATAMLFGLIGARSANPEHGAQIAACSDRLAAARAAEGSALAAVETEIRGLALAFDHDPPAVLLKLLRTYHRRRAAAAPDIVRALYRARANNRSIADL